MKRPVATGILGGLICIVHAPAAAAAARGYDYTLEYALSPADIPTVQRRHRATCVRMGPPRCRVMRWRIAEGDEAPDALGIEVARATAPRLVEAFAHIVDDTGGRTRLRELRIGERAGASPPDGTASIVVTYIGIASLAEQTGTALRAFGTVATGGIVPAIVLLPALAPWLATAALITWGMRTIWRRRRRRPRA